MPDRYDAGETWQWNLANAPDVDTTVFPTVPTLKQRYEFLGLPVASPLGIPAGPLLSADWLIYYAGHGFDILTYKTVRTVARPCYPLPNLVPVSSGTLTSAGSDVCVADRMQQDWAVSFGMPSVAPEQWRLDVRKAKDGLKDGQLLVVSVVGDASNRPADSNRDPIDGLADDYAQCAAWAMQSGADVIEANFSCPNVCSSDGQLYQNPDQARRVADRIRQAIGNVPLILKIGLVETKEHASDLLRSVDGIANALCMTNAISATVSDSSGNKMFQGQRRGICGKSILSASVGQVQMFSDLIEANQHAIEISAVGGVFTADDVRQYMDAGAKAVSTATAAMVDPMTAIKIKQSW